MLILVMYGAVYEINTPIQPGTDGFDVREVPDGSVQQGWIANEDGTFSAPPTPPPPSWFVQVTTVIDRLNSAGKLRDFCAAMKIGSLLGDLSDSELVTREMFCRSASIQSDDASFRAIITGIGADPDTILAR